MDNSKYYFVERKGDQAYPLVDILNMSQVELGNTDTLKAEFSQRLSKPVMADYHSSAKDIFKKRITEVMQGLNMEGVKFIPAQIDDTKGTVYDDYVCVVVDENTYKGIMDKKNSDYVILNEEEKNEDDIDYEMITLVLDREALQKIPLNKRLAFRLWEAPGYYLYHQSVVDAMMALEPTGMYFQDIEEYEF